MEKETALNIMQQWYSKKYVLYEMVFSGLFRRETAVLVPKTFLTQTSLRGVRDLRICGTDGLTYAMEKMLNYVGEKTPLNIYYSLASYKDGVPVMNPVLRFRKSQQEEWKAKMNAMITSYDCLIDIDSPDHDHMDFAKETASDITRELDRFQVPYYLRFSGMGYHVVIPHDAFHHINAHFNPHEEVDRSIYTLYNTITDRLNEKYSEMVDTNLHDSRRITKVPYSLSIYNDGCFVCWPFKSRYEFLTKNWDDFRLDHNCKFLGEEKIFRRGQRMFNRNWEAENTNRFLKSLKIPVVEEDELQCQENE